MAMRRTHRKTRKGCHNCKERHIKCDQLGPPCVNCQVRNIECSQSVPGNNTLRPAPALTSLLVANSSFKTQPQTNEARLLEIELIHKWSTSTYQDFNLVDNDQEFWQMVVPQDALNHEFLLEAMMAISSLHIAIATAPERSSLYHTAALQYQNRAIANFKMKALLVKSSNHQALFAFSLIVLALGFAIPRYSPQDQSTRSILSHLKTVFGLLQGTTSIYRSSQAWLHKGPFGIISNKYRDKCSAEKLDDRSGEALQRLKELNDLEYLSLRSQTSECLPDLVIWHENNLKAITWLEQCFIPDGNERTLRCLTWLATLEPDFMRSVEQAEPFALLVTMHWAVLLHNCGEERWWARSSGKILITELCMSLGSIKANWSSQIAWVCQQVGLPAVA